MNQGRIWTVVNPTVGLPLFLGSVAVTALIVHYAVLSNTTWFAGYWNGGHAKAKAASVESTGSPVALDAAAAAGVTISVAPATGDAAKTGAFVITVQPKAATADVASTTSPTTVALASPGAK